MRTRMGFLCFIGGCATAAPVWKWQLALLLCVCAAAAVHGQVRYSIPEEMAKGSFVGNIVHDLGVDVKRLKSGRARVFTEDGREYIGLNNDKGSLVVKERIDREELCGPVSPCSLHFQIVLENPMEIHRIDVEIVDVNDNAPFFSKKEIALHINEQAVSGAKFSLERARDPDVGLNTVQSYTISANEHFVLTSVSSTDGIKDLELVLQNHLDREKKEEHRLILSATDGGSPPKSGTVKITIYVLDANDNAPVFSQTLYKASLYENSIKGTSVVRVIASDADKGMNGDVTYSISRSSEGISDLFHIDPITGEITLNGNIDYEKLPNIQMTVEATDIGGLSHTCKVSIDIIDINDNAPVITIVSFSNPIPEDSHLGTVIAMFNIKDLDSGKNGQIKCSINADLPFKVQSSSSSIYTLVIDELLDREKVPEYNITITAVDEGLPVYSTNKTLHLRLSDVNDNAPVFEKQSYSAYIAENNAAGVSVFAVTARDADSRNNARVSYLLLDRETNGISVSSYISVNAESGAVHTVRSLDYEQIKELQLRVKAQDGGSPPLSSNVTVTIKVQDQNDNAPQVLYPVQTGTSVLAEMVPRSAELGYLVTKVVAVDVDSGQNAWLSYKLVKGTDRALFEVGLQNGEIRTIRPVSEKDGVKQKLTVVVEDNGQPSRSTTVNVNVVVADSFPEVLTEISDFTHEKDYNDSLTFYLILALAVVSFLFIASLIAIISVKIHRWRQSRIFYQSNLPVIPYYPPLYADVDGTGTLRHVYNYDVCGTTDSRRSDMKFIKPCSQNILDTTEAVTLPHDEKEREAAGIYANQVSFLSGDGNFLMQFFQLLFRSAF